MAEDNERQLFGQSMDDHVKTGMARVHSVLKLAMELRGLQNYSDYPGVNAALKTFRSSITTCMQNILQHEDVGVRLPSNFGLADKMEMIRDANDCLIERINSDIDEAAGIQREGNMAVSQPVVTTVEARRPALQGRGESALTSSMVLMASRNVQKPQLFFSEKVDNSRKTPFVPIIKEKPNSLKPLAVMLCITEDGTEFYSHPYQYELEHWSPDMRTLAAPLEPVLPPAVSDTPLVMVDSEASLLAAVEELKQCTHIAVDVEHHAFRSYLGLTSLVQVSTRTKDYIIDPLKLRGRLTPLNEIFTHPKITKVLHGADSDVLWLQRDCGVYLVNMFDTHVAAVLLEFPQRSLAALLSTFCGIQADKRYQRADWRIRPLPSSFIEYARQDTHYLLYIHDLLHNLLLERANGGTNLLQAVYDRSSALCLQRYEKPVITEESYLPLYNRSRKSFNNRQLYALQQLFLWRDKTAREHDESVDFVLPRHMLLHMAEVLPKEVQGIMACCNPIPALVKTELLALHSIIRAAREQPLCKTVPSRLEMPMAAAAGGGSALCLHDLSCAEEGAGLPCLLDGSSIKSHESSLFGDLFEEEPIILNLKVSSDLLGALTRAPAAQKTEKPPATEQFLSPFERYRLYVDSKEKLPVFEEAKAAGKNAENKTDGLSASAGIEDERVSRLRDHFLALAQTVPGTKPASRPKDADDLRVERLLAEVRSNMMKATPPPPHSLKPAVAGALDSDDDSSDSDSSDSSSSDSDAPGVDACPSRTREFDDKLPLLCSTRSGPVSRVKEVDGQTSAQDRSSLEEPRSTSRNSNHSTSSSSSSSSNSSSDGGDVPSAAGASSAVAEVVSCETNGKERKRKKGLTKAGYNGAGIDVESNKSNTNQSRETCGAMRVDISSEVLNKDDSDRSVNETKGVVSEDKKRTAQLENAKEIDAGNSARKVKPKQKAKQSKKRTLEQSEAISDMSEAVDVSMESKPKKQKSVSAKKQNSQNKQLPAKAQEKVVSTVTSNKKRKSLEMEVEPFSYETADFKMFETKKKKRGGKKGRGGRGGGGGHKRRGASGGRR